MYTKIEKAAIALVVRDGIAQRALLRDAIEEKYPGAIDRARGRRAKERFAAKFVGNPPEWAKRMVAKHAPDITLLNWRRSRVKWGTSGHCSLWGGSMAITVGRGAGHSEDGGKTVVYTHDEDEDRYVLLHEIAHHKTHELHTDGFWDFLYGLLVEEGLYRKTLTMQHRTGSLKVAASRARRR
jgi:hypothetical protein